MKELNEGSKKLLAGGLNVHINTRGSSMFPLIRTGDKITISPDKKLCIGDIIVFKKNDMMLGHRLVKVFEKNGIRYYQTRGDSLFSLDEPVTSDQILGKVIKIERKNVSFARRILLLAHPIMKFTMMNAFVVVLLIRLREIFSSPRTD